MDQAMREIERLGEEAAHVGVAGHREYNTGWHAALDLTNLLLVSEAITRCARERREIRGAHFREDYPEKDPALGRINMVVRQAPDRTMQVAQVPIPEMPPELKRTIEEMG